MQGRKAVNPSERSIQRSVTKWLCDQGLECIKLTTLGRYGSAGWPDLLVLDNATRLPLFLEVKTQHGELSPLQERRSAILRERGYPVFVVRSLDDAKRVVGAWLSRVSGAGS